MFIKIAFKRAKDTGSFWSKGIGWWTHSPYSHCELWLDGPVDMAYCFSAREGEQSGFKIIELKGLFDVYTLSLDNQVGLKVFNFAKLLTGKKYDWLGLLGFLGPWKVHDDRDRFCSEVCFEVLEGTGLLAANSEKRWKVSPGELSKEIQSIYGPPSKM